MAGSASLDAHPLVAQWLDFATEGRVTVRSGKVEIGQRIATAIARIAAEELDVDPDRIDVAPAATGRSPDEGYSSGSNSMEESGNAVRLAAATARRHLLALAARALEVAPESLESGDGVVRSRAANRSTTFWALARGGLGDLRVDPEAPTRPVATRRWVGRPATPRGMRALATGAARFVHDLNVPGMLHARVIRPPHYHARLASLDASVEDRLDGARLVRDGSFLAVAAADEHAAVRAAARVAGAARWAPERGLEPQDVFERLRANPRTSLPVVDGVPREAPVGEAPAPPAAAVATVEACFERPYTMHGSIGPSAALARVADGRLEIHTHSQGIYPLRGSIAEALGLPLDAVRLVHAPGPGCYGHNGADDAALDAALVARALPGTPVLLKWSREDEHAWEPYGSCMAVTVRASVDADGRIVDWSQESYSDVHGNRARPGPGGAGPRRLLATHHVADPLEPWAPKPSMGRHAGIHRNADPYYAFARRRVVKHLVHGLPLRTSTLRTLGAFANVLAIESVMDELAAAAGADPIAFRLAHLDDARARAVIEAAAGRLGFRRTPRAAGDGHGLGFARYKNAKAYCAIAVELEVTDAAEVRLRRAAIAADAGEIVDPAGLAAQLEGGFLQAASQALHEAVTFDTGGVTSRDWDAYPVLRFDEVPEIDTVLLDRPGSPFLGAGEAAGGPAAAAIANAIHDATGLRLRRLPFRPDAIRAAALDG